jgi:MerR family transcriptional regulator, copper efflux regulator
MNATSLTRRQSQQMTVGQVAKHAGLSPRAVRFYEAEGILPRARRSGSGYRVYTDQDLELLRLVAHLRRVGLSVTDVREVIRLRAHGVPPPDRVIALLETRIAGLDRELDSLKEARARLVDVLHRARIGVGGGEDVRLCRLVGATVASLHDCPEG